MTSYPIESGMPIPEPSHENFSIRYEGGDAEHHQIDLSQLGASLQGFARVLAVCAHLAHTGKYNKQYDALSVKVYAVPTEEHHCYEVVTWIKDVATSPNFWSGTGGAVLAALVAYVFSRRKEEEMKHLSEALKQALGQNADTNAKLLSTIEKMADALRPAAKQALTPIGSSCTSIGLHSEGKRTVSLDQSTKERFNRAEQNSIEPTRTYTGVISEMDMETGTCRVLLDGDETGSRVQAIISDPIGKIAGNPYVTSMGQIVPISFQAKAEVDPDGNVVKLYISDVAPEKT